MDDLTRRLRDANPYARAELSPRASQVLDDITAGRRRPSEPQRRHGPWRRVVRLPAMLTASAFTLIAVLVAVVTGVLIAPNPAVAVTPEPLALSLTDWTVDSLRDSLETAPPAGGPPSERGAEWESWYLQPSVGRLEQVVIQPQRTRTDWDGDLEGTVRIVAGTPVDRSGKDLSPLPDGLVRPDTPISVKTYGPGQFFTPFPDVPPDDAAGMRLYLDAYLVTVPSTPAEHTAADYLFAVLKLRQFWALSDAAQRASIHVVLEAPGTRIAGEATDRAGREGVVLDLGSLESAPFHRDQLVIDPDAWRILAHEQIYVGGNPDVTAPAGSVTLYTLWR